MAHQRSIFFAGSANPPECVEIQLKTAAGGALKAQSTGITDGGFVTADSLPMRLVPTRTSRFPRAVNRVDAARTISAAVSLPGRKSRLREWRGGPHRDRFVTHTMPLPRMVRPLLPFVVALSVAAAPCALGSDWIGGSNFINGGLRAQVKLCETAMGLVTVKAAAWNLGLLNPTRWRRNEIVLAVILAPFFLALAARPAALTQIEIRGRTGRVLARFGAVVVSCAGVVVICMSLHYGVVTTPGSVINSQQLERSKEPKTFWIVLAIDSAVFVAVAARFWKGGKDDK